MWIFSYPSILTYVLGAQKNRLIEMVLLSTQNICFGWEKRKLNFRYTLFPKVLIEFFFSTIDILDFITLVVCPKGIDKKCRPRSDCFWTVWSVFSVFFSDKHFVSSSLCFLLMPYVPVNNFSVMSGQYPVFLGWTSTKQQIKCHVQGHNTVTTRKSLIPSPTLYQLSHYALMWFSALITREGKRSVFGHLLYDIYKMKVERYQQELIVSAPAHKVLFEWWMLQNG